MFSLTTEEVIAGSTETLEDLHIHLLWCKTNSLPLGLQLDDFLGMTLPVTTALVLLGSNGLDLLAEGGLLGQILFLLGT